MYQLKNASTARPLLFLMIDSSDHISGKTGLTPTVTISKNGAAFASPAGAVTELTGGWYKVAGNATDTGTNGPLLLHATAAGADPADYQYEVVAYNPDDAAALGMTNLATAVTTPPTANAIAAATLDLTDGVETGLTLRQAFRLIVAILAGNRDAGVFKRKDGTTTAATATVDVDLDTRDVTIGTLT